MKKLAVFIFLFCIQLIGAAELTAFRNTVPDNYDFWLYVPYDTPPKDRTYPVVFFLHGKSLCGNDLQKVLKYGTVDALEHGRIIDAIVIAPQTPCGKWWNPDKLIKIVDWVNERYPTDVNRIYTIGMSLGGYGAMDFAAAYPDRLAAAMPLCGGASLKNPYEGLSKIPLWIIHGTDDELVPMDESLKVVDGIQENGGGDRLLVTWLDGYNHGRLSRFMYLNETYEWLFSHSLSDEDRPVTPPFAVSKELIDNAYKNMDRNFWKTKVRVNN